MRKANKHKARAWRLIQRVDGVGQSRKHCKNHGLISSLNAKRNYHSCISLYLNWREENGLPQSQQDKLADLEAFMGELSEVFMQKTLNQYKSALSIVFNKKLSTFKSQIPENNNSRNYYLSEILLIIQNLQEKNAISILLCYFSGLRAHEVITLRRKDEAKKSNSRKWLSVRFKGVENFQIYLVKGKGGLVREVAIPYELVEIIEKRRLSAPNIVIDRGIKYETYYELGFGKALSEAFSRASQKVLNWTAGLHGNRHSYAQNRLFKLLKLGLEYEYALKIISEELGHFRSSITLCYLR